MDVPSASRSALSALMMEEVSRICDLAVHSALTSPVLRLSSDLEMSIRGTDISRSINIAAIANTAIHSRIMAIVPTFI